jgi:hypothetical protein
METFLQSMKGQADNEILLQNQQLPGDPITAYSNGISMAAVGMQRSLEHNSNTKMINELKAAMPKGRVVNNPNRFFMPPFDGVGQHGGATSTAVRPMDIGALRNHVKGAKKKARRDATADGGGTAAAVGGGTAGGGEGQGGSRHPILSEAGRRDSRFFRNGLTVDQQHSRGDALVAARYHAEWNAAQFLRLHFSNEIPVSSKSMKRFNEIVRMPSGGGRSKNCSTRRILCGRKAWYASTLAIFLE